MVQQIVDEKDLRILDIVAKENITTTFKYYYFGLFIGLEYSVLQANIGRPRLEMLVAGRLKHQNMDTHGFLVNILRRKVKTNLKHLWRYKDVLQPYEGDVDLTSWKQHNENAAHINAIEQGMMALSTTLYAMDKMEERDMKKFRRPDASEVLLETEMEDMPTDPVPIVLNDILFGLGLTTEGMSALMTDYARDRANEWDTRMLMFRALRGKWVSTTHGRLLDRLDQFTKCLTEVILTRSHTNTLKAIVCWFLPERMDHMDTRLINFARSALLDNWVRHRAEVLNWWGKPKGFTMDSAAEEDQLGEERRCQHGSTRDCCGTLIVNAIDFNPDNDFFVECLHSEDNLYYTADSLDEFKVYELQHK